MNKVGKSFYIFLIGLILAAGQFILLAPCEAWGQTEDSESNASGDTILAFTSDVHLTSYNGSVNRLASWIDTIQDKYGTIDAMGFCGDMANAKANGAADYWNLTQRVMDAVSSKGVEGIYTTGNHEFDPGDAQYDSETQMLTSTANQTVVDRYKVCAEGREGDNYRIFCLGSASFDQGYWPSERNAMEEYLMHVGNDKPIIVITHFPLHFCPGSPGIKSGTTENADSVIDSLNLAVTNNTPDNPADDRTIIFLWGHNHSKFDSYYDQIYAPGDSIQYKENNYREIRFYYGAAGCMSDNEYSGGSASVKGKGLVLQIKSDDSVGFAYCNAAGADVTEWDFDKKILNIKVGEAARITANYKTLNAAENSLIWASSNKSVATVTPVQTDNGTTAIVQGVSAGTAKVTATSKDGSIKITASVTVKSDAGQQPASSAVSSADPARQMGVDGTALGRGASAAAAEKVITAMRGEKDPAGSVFSVLKLRSTKQSKKTVTLKWSKVKGAVKYTIYGNRCGKNSKMKKIATAKTNKYTVKRAVKKLAKGKYYKFIVVALDKKNRVVSSSKVIYAATAGTKSGNYKGIEVKKKIIKKAAKLKKGKALKLKAKPLPMAEKKVAKHCPLRYETSNKKIATVSKKGTVKGIRKGNCFVYAYAQNGVFKRIKITVR